ncbi:LCP family protein [Enterococcus sp. ALS3]|uniref:LCP family protein n=1 Tax=Enterococcus alishanensis TaxID=1303817 RepID=A0ABS6TAG3_9ENTE|nr:LCP family protein [Enterococcus alishanensis]MBV7389882.1 LCP family protein [Enterococcus alishanensis]
MKLWKKIVVTLILLINVAAGAGTYYFAKVTSDASSAVNSIRKTIDRDSDNSTADINNNEPFSILLMGTDTGDLGRTEQGRSDSMMVVTLNPEQKKSTIVSLERDILTEIVGYGGEDKLNAAYAYGGTKMAMDTIENLLDIPLDHYVVINMKGLKDLVDAVGGITVNNKYDFELDGISLTAGKHTLNGEQALAFARYRYEDPDGDIGRQKRQRQVVTKILRKVMSMDGVSNYRKILKAVQKNAETDLTWDEMLDIGTNYLPAFENIEQKQLQGTNQIINEIYYQILGTSELLDVQNTLKEQLGIQTSDTLPNLEDSDQAQLFNNDGGTATSDTYSDSYGTDNGYDSSYVDPNYVDPNTQYDPNYGTGY